MFSRRFPSLAALVGAGVILAAAWAEAAEPTSFPPGARERFDQGQELQRKQQYQGAISAFDEAIKLGMANFPRVFLYRADAFRGLKDYDSAIGQYSSFIEKFGLEESCRY